MDLTTLLRLGYKVAQLFGAAACLTIGLGLMLGWLYEPNLWIKMFEVIGSLVAFVLLLMDILDIHPEVD